MNGDYSASSLGYACVKGGVVGLDGQCWAEGVYSSSTGILSYPYSIGVSGLSISSLASSKTVTDTFQFAPASVVGGSITSMGSDSSSRAQRTFIGTNGNAGDIYIVVSDGRYNDGVSAGLTFKECSQLMLELGCTFSVQLDGGGSSTMVFQGQVLNAASGNQRAVVDFLYFK